MKRPVKKTAPAIELDERALARRIENAPLLSPPKQAQAAVRDWLSEIGRTPAGKSLKDLLGQMPAASGLLATIADGSPYLWELARADAERLAGILRADPDARLSALIDKTGRAIAATADEGEAMRLLRLLKSEAALLIALADIGGAWPVERVTRALTDVADAALGAAVRFLLAGMVRTGSLAPADAGRVEEGSGYVVLAMGKMGAGELNYSSDIDLIVFYDPEASALARDAEAGALYIRLTRNLVRLLQERTADGYVFRVDLRLRPDPASTQIAISLPAALDYYESVGQNWERAALIKARPAAGDIATGEAILKGLTPFIWRKYLDFAAVADVHAMKRQIHAYRGHGDIAIEGHNIKLGRGGIREIEFFVQTQQLIAGGRHPELRGRETLAMLAALVQGGWISAGACEELAAAYRFLRMVEHRLQMVADEQTHTLPAERHELDRYARFLGFDGRDSFAGELIGHLRKVQKHYASLFEDMPAQAPETRGLSFPADEDSRDTLDRLSLMGFRQPPEISAMVRRWLSGQHRALKGEAARGHLAELVPMLLDRFAHSESPDAAVAAFDRFLAGLHGGAQLFTTLRQNPDFIGLIALALGTAPRLADILAHHPQVMDALIEPAFFGALPDMDKLATGLSRSLEQADTYEDFLDRVRQFGQEHMFLIGARVLSSTVSAEQAGEAFARIADGVIRALHGAVGDVFASAHGRMRGGESALLAMGKLGGREMTATSDLDLILVYDFDPKHPESDGARSLQGTQYFARLTQRLISALTANTNYGKLYDVDMRLRPSGRSGPVATSIEAFANYQENEAWTWEHLALTRARVISASPDFAARVEKTIRTVLCRERDSETVAVEVAEMRAAIAREKDDKNIWDLKYAAGGLIDLEFIAQYLQLAHAAKYPEILDTSTARVLEKAWRIGILSVRDAEVLRPAARLYHDLTQLLRLCLPGPFDPKTAGPGLLQLLARAADLPDFTTLEAHMSETQARVRACFTRIIGAV